MPLVRGTEVFSQVVLAAGEHTVNRRIHRIEVHREGKKTQVFEGSSLPELVFINTTKNVKGQHVMRIDAKPVPEKKEFSVTTMFVALLSFIGLAVYVLVAAIEAHSCFI